MRLGRFAQPNQPNQQSLDSNLWTYYGDQIEIERTHTWRGQPGKLRVLAFRNRTRMSRYQDALDVAVATASVPDINAVRNNPQIKMGFGLNLEQALSPTAGLFARASWADGHTETYAFTEIDHSISGGLVLKGANWGRAADTAGFAFAFNGLSQAHRNYLAAGGLGFFIGDGNLNYRPESIVEMFYNLNVGQNTWLTMDWQHIRNPAYNADRGPVNVGSVRLHLEF